MSYTFLQQYWWFVVSLLGALLVFLLFVQGANSLVFSLGRTEEGQRKVIESTGRKWEITFTTLVTFGGAFFASFPLFYSTSFGGAEAVTSKKLATMRRCAAEWLAGYEQGFREVRFDVVEALFDGTEFHLQRYQGAEDGAC